MEIKKRNRKDSVKSFGSLPTKKEREKKYIVETIEGEYVGSLLSIVGLASRATIVKRLKTKKIDSCIIDIDGVEYVVKKLTE